MQTLMHLLYIFYCISNIIIFRIFLLKGVHRSAASTTVCFVFGNFVQLVILEAVPSMSLALRKAYWSLHSFENFLLMIFCNVKEL